MKQAVMDITEMGRLADTAEAGWWLMRRFLTLAALAFALFLALFGTCIGLGVEPRRAPVHLVEEDDGPRSEGPQ